MKNILHLKYALRIIFVTSSLKRTFFVTFVTSKNHKQFVSRTWPDRFQRRLSPCLATWVIPGGQQVYLPYCLLIKVVI